MKRTWTASPSSSQDMLVDCGSQHVTEVDSLKRVRVAVSPGVLRLEEDLARLQTKYGWMKMNDRRWLWRPGSVLAEKTNDPLRLLVTFPQEYQVWIELPRLYPHMPPTVPRIVHPKIKQVLVASVEQQMQPFHVPQDTLLYRQWSPVQQLGDLFHFLVNTLPLNDVTPPQGGIWGQMEGVRNLNSSSSNGLGAALAPNRFDQGYDRSIDNHCDNQMDTDEL